MRSAFVVSVFLVLATCAWAGAAEPAAPPWDLEALSAAPAVHDAPDHGAEGVRAIFYDGLPCNGKPTRVFAYVAVPDLPEGKKAPAMVLVHGGGGSAFAGWVRLWLKRGYAAIAMDTCGCVSGGGHRNHPRHDRGGPPGWGGFDQVDAPLRDQWTYHAVADVVLAHSLLRSMPGVDAERTGLTGISWGGYLTCIVAGVDPRFKVAMPVYGCGFLGENSAWVGRLAKMGPEMAERWLARWDPSRYLPAARMPVLWVAGTNDFAYPMDSLRKSYRLPQGPRTLCIRPRMPHGHGPGQTPTELHVMADAVLKGGKPLATVRDQGRDGHRVWVTFTSPVPVAKAVLHYTCDTGTWKKRKWQSAPAALDAAKGRASADLPEGVTVYYLNLTDARGAVVSSEHVVISRRAAVPNSLDAAAKRV